MRRISALFPTILSLAFLPLLNAAELTGVWKADGTNTPHSSPEAPGEAAVTVRFPGSAQLYREPDRATFRPSREAFEAAEFELEARVITDTPDPVRAFRLVREAAEAGSARAQVRLGDYYLNGDQVAQSISEALALYRKAFDAGYLSAAVKLGRCAELGIGSDPEPVRAAELYGIAARAGDADGQYAFGRCHLKGIGMEPDAAGAVFWFKTATAVGQLDAVRELGVCYLTGTGVEKDEAEGSRLIEAAAASGDPEALVILSNN